MTGLADADYGPLAQTVAAAGSLLSAMAAIAAAWRGKARWEPVEEDLPGGSRKATGLLSAIGIAAIWYWMRDPAKVRLLTEVSVGLGASCVVSLVIYGILVAVFTYERVVATAPNETHSEKIIGGFWLTQAASQKRRQRGLTIQELFLGAAYDPDKVWPRLSRALSKACFVLAYGLLVSTGTIGLTCASILFGGQLSLSE
ncbi:hypothetical protein [Engelhardtia mirabilis]|uniref:hypothetical protein n=1 Tax=Engelhardtia mirabilis TaxID=2528011 RepID=UPI0011A08D23